MMGLEPASLGWGKGYFNFEAIRTRTLVSIATDSSHKVIMGKAASPLFSRLFFIVFFSYSQVTMTYLRAWMSSKFGQL